MFRKSYVDNFLLPKFSCISSDQLKRRWKIQFHLEHFLCCSQKQNKQLFIPRRKYLQMVFQAKSNAWVARKRVREIGRVEMSTIKYDKVRNKFYSNLKFDRSLKQIYVKFRTIWVSYRVSFRFIFPRPTHFWLTIPSRFLLIYVFRHALKELKRTEKLWFNI